MSRLNVFSMKSKMIVSPLIFFFFTQGSEAMCLPPSLNLEPKNQNIYQARMVEESTKEFEELIKSELPSDYKLLINLEPLNPRVNAEIKLEDKEAVISVWGGMIHHPELTKEAFWLLLCHEIGHLLGGPPLKSRTGWSSTEGQADYYSASTCAKTLRLYEKDFLEGTLALTKIYADVVGEVAPSIDRCDERRVTRTNFGYPSVQCRLDTILSGWEGKARPQCWFRE